MEKKNTYKVTLHVVNKVARFIGAPCYIAGNFNNWSTDSHLMGLIPPLGEQLRIVLNDVPEGRLAFKLTRGNWQTADATLEGRFRPPFTKDIDMDTALSFSIDAWRDEFPPSTASPQVHVLAESFYFPKLNVYKKIWIYLPKDYGSSTKFYPVLYMHDGQHLFDEATAVGRAGPVEWMVDETIDEAKESAIVIGIAHPDAFQERKQEMLVYPFEDIADAKGRFYLEDLVYVLKPFVDRHYRTLTDSRHTAILGSSLGGLLSLYAGLLYPEIFGTVGAFSPSIWMDDGHIYAVAEKCLSKRNKSKEQLFYFYAGAREKRSDRPPERGNIALAMQNFVTFLTSRITEKPMMDLDPDGEHGALYWQKAFIRFYHWWQGGLN